MSKIVYIRDCYKPFLLSFLSWSKICWPEAFIGTFLYIIILYGQRRTIFRFPVLLLSSSMYLTLTRLTRVTPDIASTYYIERTTFYCRFAYIYINCTTYRRPYETRDEVNVRRLQYNTSAYKYCAI